MFTLKFHTVESDYWEVYHANSYSSEVVDDVREVFIEVEGDEKIIVGRDKNHFNACYIVNELGNTVDRIYPPLKKNDEVQHGEAQTAS